MASLPDDLFPEILSRLPVKSLLRFQSVCKSWNSLIKTPNFIKTHLNQTLDSKSDRHLIHFNVTHKISELDLDHHRTHLSFSDINHPLQHHHGVRMVGSCNGVVCISTFFKEEVVLFNPLTNSHRSLPSVPKPNLGIYSIVLGFGYDSSKNGDYKILRIVQMAANSCLPWPINENKAQVYSFNDNSWRCIEGIPYHLYFYDYIPAFLINNGNGGLHYFGGLSWYLSIGRFDLQTESFSLIEIPYHEKKINMNLVLTELGGCLCLLINSGHEYQKRELEYVELWVMKEYGNKESWVKLFYISQPNIFGITTYTRALAYSNDGTRILLEINTSEYCWYDLDSKSIERITSYGISETGFTTIMTHVGSLVSLEDN